MDIKITDEELDQLKQKALANAEARFTEEILQSMRRTVVYEATLVVARQARARLEAMLAEGVADDVIRNEVARVLDGMAKQNHNGQSELHHIVERALFRIIDTRADDIGRGIVRILSTALKVEAKESP